MHIKLAEALDLLEINSFPILSEDGEKIAEVNKAQHINALFSYFNLAGYLSDNLLDKAVNYLALEKAFSVSEEQVKADLKHAAVLARQSGKFDPTVFCEHFAEQDYFTVPDIIDLITFLQQTAFDRQFGEERDRLHGKPWIEKYPTEFIDLARLLAVVSPLPPRSQHYCGVGIMGGASVRASERINYFSKLNENAGSKKLSFDSIWALTGNRELSKGLDDPDLVEAVAKFYSIPLQYVKKPVGKDTREFADGITEAMMLKYLIQSKFPLEKIKMLNSDAQKEHWRVTTQQNAVDIAHIILQAIEQKQVLPNSEDNSYHFMIIAEQPYAGRMARQVQRAFDAEVKKLQFPSKINVEGCGAAVMSHANDALTRLNSELGALAAERFIDARIKLANCNVNQLRDPKIIMFSSRDDFYLQQKKNKQIEKESLLRLSIFVDPKGELKTSVTPEAAKDTDSKHAFK